MTGEKLRDDSKILSSLLRGAKEKGLKMSSSSSLFWLDSKTRYADYLEFVTDSLPLQIQQPEPSLGE